MQNEGYDGVIREEDGEIWEYVAFNPNQIKSADAVTYDDAGNVIPLSEHFNPEKEDIRYSLAGTEVAFILENYDNIQDIETAVEAVVKRYPKDSVMLANILSDYRQNADEEDFIQGLRTFAKYFGDKQEKDRSGNKQVVEETFGGI